MLQSEYQDRWFKLKRFLVIAVCCILWQANVIAQGTTDTFHVYFDLNMPALNEKGRQTIDSLLYHDAVNAGKYILIIGYADYLGNEADNHILSENRAKHVYEYLAASGIGKEHIRSFIGKGAIERDLHTTDGYPKDRRVDIVIGGDKSVFTNVSNTKTPVPVGRKAPVKSRMDIIVDSLKVGQTFLLDNLYFYPGRHTIREESLPELDNLYNVLTNNPGLKIKIEGHVCCVPDDKDALDEDINPIREQKDDPSPYFLRRLSLNRAMYINYYLVKRGIDSKRLQYEGYGRSRPVVKQEKSMADENKNRRVEIRIIEK